ncbi:molybdopterin molybdotransferase MoeA [Kitasatospora sp. NBC_01287]|uniref:molybdopterin molybdotransferase MoeA n=1 Tax=Kitasatospora sp. NBC_01287 TaxID=2903573 RepID=UPI002256208B|nr:molybdopterin molybdotransferase MoeA [Kitasatospora sp. NBC_01287]MCX4747627.1 molybdopterin molybdotransferase MoeA [Kitasatospora sp. NBC_01287]
MGTAGTATPTPVASWPRARAIARQAAARPLPAVERELAAALGHTLAAPLAALTDLPAFDTSAMDGWAVAGPGPWRLAGRVLAGRTPPPLADGWATGIATGAQLPPGATAVLRREHGRVERPALASGTLHPTGRAELAPGQDVRPRGQECRSGEELLPAGTPVTAAVLGLAAACGYDTLTVRRRPTVELLVLGDELLPSGLPGPGLVRDALGPLLQPWLGAAGAELLGRRTVRDDFALLRDAVRYSTAEVVVTTGGTAAGPVDFLHAALAECGARLLVDGVAVRPGHPMLLAELPPAAPGTGPVRHLVGLPGNPLAAVAGAVTLALPLLDALSGRRTGPGRFARAGAALPGHPEDTRLLPVRSTADGPVPLAFDGPAMLRGLALAQALAVVPPGGLAAGEPVELLGVPG